MRTTDYEYDYPEPDEMEPDDELLDAMEEQARHDKALDRYEADCIMRQETGLDY